MVWASLFTPSSFFLKHVLIFSTRIFPYCWKVATTLWISLHFYVVDECCHNIVEMFSYNVLRQHCSNTLETFLKYVAATSCANFPSTLWQCFATIEYDVKATSGGNIFTTVAQHLSNVPGLRCSNLSRQHFHNFRSTLWQRSRNFPGNRWCKRFPNFQ